MIRDRSRSVLSGMALLTAVALLGGCRSVAPKQEKPAVVPPAFQPSPTRAEKVDETKGFKEATPSVNTLPASPSSRAELLNAQGVLKSIYFDFDKSSLRSDALEVLAKDQTLIRQETTLKVLIEGNCDERGTVEYNLALGDRRARAARDYLVSQGLPATRLRTVSYGKEKPLDPAHNDAAWSKNRRDDFVFVAD